MALHATASWPLMRRGSMTAPSSDLGVTEPANEQRQPSNPNDHEWARFLDSLHHYDQDASSSSTIELGALALDDNFSAQFGAMDNMMDVNPLQATTTSSAPPAPETKAVPQQYMNWQPMPTDFFGYEQHPSPAWMSDPQQQHPQQQHLPQFDPNTEFMHGHDGLGIQLPPTSHPVYHREPLQYDQPFLSQESPLHYSNEYQPDMGVMWNHQEQSVTPHDDLFADDEEPEPEDGADPCYAQLLYSCLKDAPEHTMSLRELYEWVSQHSQKAKDPKNRGWQNSVRHNLSMNAAFQRVPHSANGPKKGSLWRLTDDALRMGVISTTRYRKDPKRKSDRRSATPALNRQASGAKGGRATRDATRMRQQQHRGGGGGGPLTSNRFRRSQRSHTSHFSPYSNSPSPGMPPTSSPHAPSPYFLDLDVDEQALYPLPISAGQTPPSQTLMMYNDQANMKPVQQSLEFLSMEYGQTGFFGDPHSDLMMLNDQQHQQQQQQSYTPTPSQASYMSDSGFLTDDNIPALMMPGSNQNSRETTAFQ